MASDWTGWQKLGNLLWLLTKIGITLVVLYFAVIFWGMCIYAARLI